MFLDLLGNQDLVGCKANRVKLVYQDRKGTLGLKVYKGNLEILEAVAEMGLLDQMDQEDHQVFSLG